MIRVKVYPNMGRGIEAATGLLEGDIVAVCELLVLSPDDTVKVNDTELKHYTFKYSNDQDCLVLGLGEIFNHSDSPNIGYKLERSYDGSRHLMVFTALRDIEPSEQLFIDYSADVLVDVSSYVNSKSLI